MKMLRSLSAVRAEIIAFVDNEERTCVRIISEALSVKEVKWAKHTGSDSYKSEALSEGHEEVCIENGGYNITVGVK